MSWYCWLFLAVLVWAWMGGTEPPDDSGDDGFYPEPW